MEALQAGRSVSHFQQSLAFAQSCTLHGERTVREMTHWVQQGCELLKVAFVDFRFVWTTACDHKDWSDSKFGCQMDCKGLIFPFWALRHTEAK